MIETLSNIATSFGLASSAGLNAYLPLLIVALTARFTTLLTLNPPFNALTDNLVIGVLVVLLLIETFVDKVPAVDTINDAIQTFVRPVAGAILFAANASVISDMSPALAVVCGLVLAGGVHAVKATVRPVVTASTGGLGNPVVSTAEDVASAAVTVTAILWPLVGVALLVALAATVFLWRMRRADEPSARPRG